ncbi:hypothetical protein Poli38472_001518 [Pythium oligandrum]|uniref:Uncharacterized protein n=1 Tax=Pythium oligandrum TaxID=41045 RepID=A0A8K1FRU7_PYTOL|nr:hypothetical protein Poli38472_001518 [Pythium oligandrum]|eukprot:TMW69362.1 hypothetical protein Poli38472_001518 [Pythium oligandrum]
MVHFNVRLRDNTYGEWRNDYLDYKRLKKTLKKQQEIDAHLSRASTSSVDGSLSGSSGHEGTYKPPTRAAQNTSELQALLYAPVPFEEMLETEYHKVEHAYEKHLGHLRGQFVLLRDQYRPDAPSATQESVKNTLMELHRLLNHLNNFALLNYTGFVKILKKHDKMFPTQPQLARTHRERLLEFDFASAKVCRAVLAEVEQMFADCFCEGNRTVAVASLMTKRQGFVHWGHIYMGIKIGSCLVLLIWVVWDSLIVPTFRNEREKHLIDLAVTRAYPVYRGIGCCLLLHWLLGVSMYVWRSARINYRYIFELDPRTTPHYTEVFSDATNMTIVYLVNVLMYYKVVNGYFPEQLLHRGYYPLALFVYTFYYYIVRPWGQQKGLWRTVLETIGSPFFSVTFFHVFVGDYLTSTVKVTQDLAWSMCFFATKEFLLKDHVQPLDVNGRPLYSIVELRAKEASCQNNVYYAKVAVPLICALPLWFRFIQSLRRIYDSETWWPNLPNAVKYALAQVVVLFGLFHPFYRTHSHFEDVPESLGGLHTFQLVWITLFTLSSLYTWVWDVWMDWGLGRPQYKFLGDRQMFSRLWVYYAAILADFFLRFAWTLSLIPPHSSSSLPLYLQPFTMVIELFRRTFWGFFRLENEHLRNTQGFRRVDFIPLHYDHGVGDEREEERDNVEPLAGSVFLLKILLILFLVLGLSVLAIIVEK